ncbi:M20 metallopeptidase family protein [Geobacillus thermodenitrificans]|uniref:N-acyl-L-amino acid amidohydrolase-like protein n=1 Tax=Geobacillus thermodenitrificans (strain NG80-2) TaxID=420246 RepID=A4IQN1_GEOTN|nr:amidohydrolase [Geobacillus thermodenitrificans]ABO67635.1 N-acyl-L-amino acid amidohydrolase-like protein [Geobacillus thermodenitrificans NG80-2]MEC5187486.1 amidohydrolase [Geobacillus thermodenitrificans]
MIKNSHQTISTEVIKWRRYFHQYPELSFEEKRTSKVVGEFLKSIGLHVKENVNGYGVVADLIGSEKGPTIAFRADMDALPIQEETGLPFASKIPGVMHACGHDGHTAILMGAAALLAAQKNKLKGNVRFIFQPAEELSPGGAIGMIREGVLHGVDAIFGLHLWSEFPSGTFWTCYGPMMSSTDHFMIEIEGKGGHGGMPHKAIDSIVIASHLIMSAQHIISRNIDPLESGVITFGKLHAGTAFNIIANNALLEGTVRSFTPEVRKTLQTRLEELIEGLEKIYGAKITMNYRQGYPSVINHDKEVEMVIGVAKEVFGVENTRIMRPVMVGEDFSYYLKEIPGAFCFVGAGDPNHPIYPHHHPRFQIDESVLPLAVQWFYRLALEYLQ